ncbi:MAG: glycosyltransferase [Deltaproteobacteria bacterium]
MRFHSLLPSFQPHDATGSIASELRGLLRRLGFDSELFSPDIDPELRGLARPASELPAALSPSDAVLYHHGIASDLVPLLSSLRCRKVLAYHNVTPARFYAPFDPAVARGLEDGRLQLAALREQVEVALCFSEFSARELREAGFPRVSVVPPPLEPWRVVHPGDERLYRRLCDGPTNLLFVGRVAPNKKIEDLIDLAILLNAHKPARAVRLVVAGPHQRASDYFRMLQKRAAPLGKRALFLGAVSQHELCACYRAAHLFVSMSEHEGFGLPLCEAMATGVPVVAYDGGAVREALGGAGVLFSPKSLPHVAALCELLLEDPVQRRRIIEGQRRRAAQLGPERTLPPLAQALAPLIPAPRRRPVAKRPRVAFVIHRYGAELVGGAERHCRSIAQRMARHWQVEVLTTCATDYLSWENALPPGLSSDGPVALRRFPSARARDMRTFNALSGRLFGRAQERLTEERWLAAQGPDCPQLLSYLAEQRDSYDGFVFFTYLYEPTALGLTIAGKRALFVPTAHDEPPIRFGIYRQTFAAPAAILFNTPEEQALCEGLFELPGVHREAVGIGVEPSPGDPHALRAKLGLRGDYLLYLGRICHGKGLRDLVLAHGQLRRKLGAQTPALVLAGTNELGLSERPGLYLPGPMNDREKWDALAGAAAVVVPSAMESLSLLALEAWSAGKPVIVNGESAVLAGQCRRSGGGLSYHGHGDFAAQAAQLLQDPGQRRRLGEAGQGYVAKSYRWEQIEERYLRILEEHVLGRAEGRSHPRARPGSRSRGPEARRPNGAPKGAAHDETEAP